MRSPLCSSSWSVRRCSSCSEAGWCLNNRIFSPAPTMLQSGAWTHTHTHHHEAPQLHTIEANKSEEMRTSVCGFLTEKLQVSVVFWLRNFLQRFQDFIQVKTKLNEQNWAWSNRGSCRDSYLMKSCGPGPGKAPHILRNLFSVLSLHGCSLPIHMTDDASLSRRGFFETNTSSESSKVCKEQAKIPRLGMGKRSVCY